MGNSIYWVDARVDYGAVGDNTADDTIPLQNAINGASAQGKLLIIPNGTYKITSPLTLPAGGVYITGTDPAGNFSCVIRPNNCRAFTISAVHHSIIEKLTIWPQGTTPPANYIYLTNCYSIVLRDIRIHTNTVAANLCTDAAILQDATGGGCNDIHYQHIIIRADGDPYPNYGYRFANGCGSASLIDCDVETCSIGIEWQGGQISIYGLYTERHGTHTVECNPSSDSSASLTIVGGVLRSNASGSPIAIKTGTKNLNISGTYLDGSGSANDGWFYDLTGSSNIYLNPSKLDLTRWGSSVTIDPMIVTFQIASDIVVRIAPTYGATVTPALPLGNRLTTATITATNNTAFTIAGPTGTVQDGARLTIVIRNASGGALGVVTFAAVYKKGAAWTQPANGFSRSITFVYDSANWIETDRTAVDVTN